MEGRAWGREGKDEGRERCHLRDAGAQEGILDIARAAHEDHHESHDLLQLQPLQRPGIGLPHVQHQLTQVVHKVFLHSRQHASISTAVSHPSAPSMLTPQATCRPFTDLKSGCLAYSTSLHKSLTSTPATLAYRHCIPLLQQTLLPQNQDPALRKSAQTICAPLAGCGDLKHTVSDVAPGGL